MTEEFVRVPFYVERDNKKTFFLPACRMKGGYRIGPKGSEVTIEDYWQALAKVAAMQPPRFRRPNADKNYGIVRCESGAFEEVSRAHIEAERLEHGG